MSSSTGSRPTTSSCVAHSSQVTVSPLLASVSTWTWASQSGQVLTAEVPSPPKGSTSPGRRGRPREALHRRAAFVSSADNLTAPLGFCNNLSDDGGGDSGGAS